MKFLHISDLHIGKRLNEYSLVEDQKYILDQIVEITKQTEVDALLVAGDVYDKSIPSAEAVQIFDEFLTSVAQMGIKTFVISGNHDSAERLSFANRLLSANGIFISSVYNGVVEPICLQDEYGDVNFYLLPFVKPSNVSSFFDDKIETYTDALACAIEHMNIDNSKRNVILSHPFITGALKSESENISVGGLDNVDARVFDDFDYVALGHIHKPQICVKENIRYCGSPLKYSFSESKDTKVCVLVEMGKKGDVKIDSIPLKPLREMVEIKGKYDDIMARSFYQNTTYQTDFVHITLTDEDDVMDAIGKLRTVYKNIMKLDYDNTRTKTFNLIDADQMIEFKSPQQLFGELYKLQNNRDLNKDEEDYISALITEIWGEK